MTTASLSANPILAADDDQDDVDLLRILLRKTGVPNPLQAFHAGEELIATLAQIAQKSLKSMRPLLCFLDIKMPAMTGHQVLRWIRSQPELDRLPVVMLSSSEHPRDIQQCADHGAQCYLAKYPQPAVLKHIVQDARRFADGVPADECFRLPQNLLLVRCRRLTAPTVARATHPSAGQKPLA